MNMNAASDAILDVLTPIHARTYRNKPPKSLTFPYVVYFLDTALPTDPSTDIYLNIDIYEDPNASIRTAETIADSIQNTLDDLIIRNASLNVHSTIEQRQYVSNNDLVTSQMINLRFVLRSYFI